MEYPRGDSDITDRVDYALIENGDLKVCIEAKRPTVNLDAKTGQLKRYMRLHRCNWGLLTNGDRYIILRDEKEFELDDIIREVDCELEHLVKRESALAPLRR
nr:type I restriction enzyme HsdR N-terminal domain-containing protein [Natronolimnobius sp. AArcel1]